MTPCLPAQSVPLGLTQIACSLALHPYGLPLSTSDWVRLFVAHGSAQQARPQRPMFGAACLLVDILQCIHTLFIVSPDSPAVIAAAVCLTSRLLQLLKKPYSAFTFGALLSCTRMHCKPARVLLSLCDCHASKSPAAKLSLR